MNTGQLRVRLLLFAFPFSIHSKPHALQGKKRLYDPHERRQLTQKFLSEYVSKLSFGRVHLSVGTTAVSTEQKIFQVPDLEFGNGRILSTCGTPGAQHVSLDSLGHVRATLFLRDNNAGFALAWATGPSVVLYSAEHN